MSDVLFDFNKYTLKPEAREKLAKVSGILLAYPEPEARRWKATPITSARTNTIRSFQKSAPME